LLIGKTSLILNFSCPKKSQSDASPLPRPHCLFSCTLLRCGYGFHYSLQVHARWSNYKITMLIWVLLESVHLKTQEAFELRWRKNVGPFTTVRKCPPLKSKSTHHHKGEKTVSHTCSVNIVSFFYDFPISIVLRHFL
jgi:hypothetical protein